MTNKYTSLYGHVSQKSTHLYLQADANKLD